MRHTHSGQDSVVVEQLRQTQHALQCEIRVRFHIIRNACIQNVVKYQSCMVSKLRIIWKQTVAKILKTHAIIAAIISWFVINRSQTRRWCEKQKRVYHTLDCSGYTLSAERE